MTPCEELILEQATLECPIVDDKATSRLKANRPGKLGLRRQDISIPTGKLLFKQVTQTLVQRREPLYFSDSLSIGRVGDDQTCDCSRTLTRSRRVLGL